LIKNHGNLSRGWTLGVLFIVSAEAASGKTAICAGLAVNLTNDGKRVGYLKPQATEAGSDGDIAFMKKVPGAGDAAGSPDTVKGRDVVLVEAGLDDKAAGAASRATYGAVKEMKAKVIAVEAYSGQASKYIDVYQGFGGDLLGVVLNKVPVSQLGSVREKAAAEFIAAGIKLLGVIPESRVLLAITVGELADIVKGKILNNPEKSGELVENYLLGAMVVGSGLDYFGRKSAKAAIIHQDRPDMQLAALETPTRCLVLSGKSQPPIYNVFQKAESLGVPVISTDSGTTEIVKGIEEALPGARLRQEKKLPGLAELIKQNLDIKAVV
jgi:BioD-like phosphotransacetylase family protein